MGYLAGRKDCLIRLEPSREALRGLELWQKDRISDWASVPGQAGKFHLSAAQLSRLPGHVIHGERIRRNRFRLLHVGLRLRARHCGEAETCKCEENPPGAFQSISPMDIPFPLKSPVAIALGILPIG